MLEDAQPSFHAALDELDDRFTEAGLRIVDQMPRLVRGFLAGDTSMVADVRDLADECANDIRFVEDSGFIMLARQQPVGRDLRRLVAMLRMCVDVDRSGALLRHAIETVTVSPPVEYPEQLRIQVEELARLSADVFRGGMDAWRTKDALAVNELDIRDERVDDLHDVLLATAGAVSVPSEVRVILGLIARYFERIADHGVAIARDTAFVTTGERVTLPSKVG